MKKRNVKKVVQGKQTVDGAGVHLTRVLSRGDIYDFDPFLMLDSFDSKNPSDYLQGFPWHPHRGIETVTYLISGSMEHQDSIGNKGLIKPGGSQWMVAGSGVQHQEMPQDSEHMLGFQLWINLPKKDKMTTPAYNDLQLNQDIKTVKETNAVINVISGEYQGVQGFTPSYVQATILDVSLENNETFKYEVSNDKNVFVFLINDNAIINEIEYQEKSAILFDEGDYIEVKTSSDKDARFIIFSAQPLKEPIAWAGPIVMNTDEEISETFRELENNTFLKHQ
ncbi:pirin family protein [Erysipelotrichaceae bacterium OttesenSCG-928-M19]|nr:pirin family protein [Erysipelotrichaceae bacterium OttesenSCG-928-M19]